MDPIADMLIRIKNAQGAGHEEVSIPYSKFKHEVVKALSRLGFLGKVGVKGKRSKKGLEVKLGYRHEDENRPLISGVKLLSKASRKLYTSYKDLRPSTHRGLVLLTTPQGIMSEKEAKKEKVGGQLMAEIW